jgi:NifB/MoaA-like Fe-S oxidoreductase
LKPDLPDNVSPKRKLSVVTGVLGTQVLTPLSRRLNQVEGVDLQIIEVENKYYGSPVTVTGLLTGEDILEKLASVSLGEVVLIPELLLNEDNLFLDNISWSEFKDKLPAEVRKVPNDARELTEEILGINI